MESTLEKIGELLLKSVIKFVLYDVSRPFSLKSKTLSDDTEIPTPNLENRLFIYLKVKQEYLLRINICH